MGVGQNPSWDMFKPGDQLQEMSDLSFSQLGFHHQVLGLILTETQMQSLNQVQIIV